MFMLIGWTPGPIAKNLSNNVWGKTCFTIMKLQLCLSVHFSEFLIFLFFADQTMNVLNYCSYLEAHHYLHVMYETSV